MKLPFGFRAFLSTAFVIAFSIAALAQQEPAFPGSPVKMVVTVEARHGKSKEVPTVRAEDVVVTQGKQQDKVLSWQPVETPQVGLQLVVLMDDSLSTLDLGSKLNDIRKFIDSQPETVQVGVAYMRNGTAMLSQNITNDHAQAAKSLRLPLGDAGASSSPYFALQDLIKRWPKTNAAREVVMITDGIDRFWDNSGPDDPYVNSTIELAQREGVVVNAIYAHGEGHFGHTFWRINFGQMFLSQLADATGGDAYYLGNESPVTFTPYFDDLNTRMQHQYLLTFVAQPAKKPGLQRIKLSTEVPNAELVAQTHVYVPAA